MGEKYQAEINKADEELQQLEAELKVSQGPSVLTFGQELTEKAQRKCDRVELDPARDTPPKLDAMINSMKQRIEKETVSLIVFVKLWLLKANRRPLPKIREDYALAKKRYKELDDEISKLTEMHKVPHCATRLILFLETSR